MFGHRRQSKALSPQEEQAERSRLQSLSEKELMIEMLIALKKVDRKCDGIARKIVIWGD